MYLLGICLAVIISIGILSLTVRELPKSKLTILYNFLYVLFLPIQILTIFLFWFYKLPWKENK